MGEIDRRRRDLLAEKLRHLVNGRITNDGFEAGTLDDFVDSTDPGVKEIWSFGWSLYPDWETCRLQGERAVPEETRERAKRAVVFLRSDVPYEWPRFPERPTIPDDLGWLIPGILVLMSAFCGIRAVATGEWSVSIFVLAFTLASALPLWALCRVTRPRRLARFEAEERRWRQAGDFSVWPFFRKGDLEAAIHERPLLGAGAGRGGSPTR